MAEGLGFEPRRAFTLAVFKTAALSRTLPPFHTNYGPSGRIRTDSWRDFKSLAFTNFATRAEKWSPERDSNPQLTVSKTAVFTVSPPRVFEDWFSPYVCLPFLLVLSIWTHLEKVF